MSSFIPVLVYPGCCLSDLLEVLATDPATVANFAAFCRRTGNRLVEARETDGLFRLLIEKATSEIPSGMG